MSRFSSVSKTQIYRHTLCPDFLKCVFDEDENLDALEKIWTQSVSKTCWGFPSQWQGKQEIPKEMGITHGGTRTHNLPLRRRTPYPLGHAGCVLLSTRKQKWLFNDFSANVGGFVISLFHNRCGSNRGREVKASDSKSDSLWERRFESCRLRIFLTRELAGDPFRVSLCHDREERHQKMSGTLSLSPYQKRLLTLTWFEHAAFRSGVGRATVAPQSLLEKCLISCYPYPL